MGSKNHGVENECNTFTRWQDISDVIKTITSLSQFSSSPSNLLGSDNDVEYNSESTSSSRSNNDSASGYGSRNAHSSRWSNGRTANGDHERTHPSLLSLDSSSQEDLNSELDEDSFMLGMGRGRTCSPYDYKDYKKEMLQQMSMDQIIHAELRALQGEYGFSNEGIEKVWGPKSFTPNECEQVENNNISDENTLEKEVTEDVQEINLTSEILPKEEDKADTAAEVNNTAEVASTPLPSSIADQVEQVAKPVSSHKKQRRIRNFVLLNLPDNQISNPSKPRVLKGPEAFLKDSYSSAVSSNQPPSTGLFTRDSIFSAADFPAL